MASTTATDARLAMEIRLLALESRIGGAPSYTTPEHSLAPCSSAADNRGPTARGTSISKRVLDVAQSIEKSGEGSDTMKRFLTNYESYRPLLIIPGTDPSLSSDPTDANQDASNGAEDRITDADLIPAIVKSTMVLEAARDIHALERDLRRVDNYKERGVDGAGELEDLLKLSKKLDSVEKESKTRGVQADRIRRDVGDVLMRYNDYNSTMSALFLDLHRQLEALEDKIARAERKKRKDLEERY